MLFEEDSIKYRSSAIGIDYVIYAIAYLSIIDQSLVTTLPQNGARISFLQQSIAKRAAVMVNHFELKTSLREHKSFSWTR